MDAYLGITSEGADLDFASGDSPVGVDLEERWHRQRRRYRKFGENVRRQQGTGR
jgi:hypothetical protein